MLGGVVWWNSGPYAPFTDTTGAVRLFEIIPAQTALGQGALLAALAVIAWRFGVQLRHAGRAWLQRRGGAVRGDVAAGLFLLATLGFYPRERASRTMLLDGLAQFPNDLVTFAGMALLCAGAVIGIVSVAPALCEALVPLWGRIEASPPRRFAPLVGAAGLVSALTVSLGHFHGRPVATDGANYLFQANMFAHGHLTLPPPPVPSQFAYISTIVEPRWRSIGNPGWPALLTVGVWTGAPWLMNPLCHAGAVVLLYLLGRRWWDDRTGRAAALLGLGSPFLLLPAGSHMAHTSALFGLLLFLWLWQGAMDRNAAARALAAGLALGWAAATRPLDAAAVALPWGAWTLVHAGRRRVGVATVCALGAGVAVPLGLLAAYNSAVNGSPTTFGYSVYYGEQLRLGFGADADVTYIRQPHSPGRAVMNANNNLNALNKILLGWPLPALGVVLFGLRAGARNGWDATCAASALVVVGAYFFFLHADFMYGARYYHAAAGVLLLLAARGAVAARDWLGPRVAAAAAGVCVVFAAAAFYPPLLRFYQPEAPVFQGVYTRLDEALAQARPTQAVVVVKTGATLGYGSAFWRNGDGIESDVIYAKDAGGDNAALRAAFPDRAFYRFDPDADPPRLTPF